MDTQTVENAKPGSKWGNRSMKKIILFLLLALAIGVFCAKRYYSPDLVRDTDKRAVSSAGDSGLEQTILAFSIDGKSSKGVKQWHLEGKAAELVDDKIYLEDLIGTAFGEKFTINLQIGRAHV